jgi:hypothetical protein
LETPAGLTPQLAGVVFRVHDLRPSFWNIDSGGGIVALAAVCHFVSVRLLRFVQNFGSVTYRMSEPLTYPELSHVDSIDATGYTESEIEQVRQSSLNFEQTLVATCKAFDTLGNELSQIHALDPPTTAFMESATKRLLS